MGPRDNVAGIRERPALMREDLFFCLQLPWLFLCSWLLRGGSVARAGDTESCLA